MYKQAMMAGALLAGIAVILGAFAAHGLTKMLPPEKIDVFQKGVTYQMYHSLALLIVGIVYSAYPYRSLEYATTAFMLGILFFSGSLYLYPVLEARGVAIPVAARLITPLGGLCYIAGWGLFFGALLKKA
jgi:uncharacterized membrane protein YgdD (TMEM256/DUF423 family)